MNTFFIFGAKYLVALSLLLILWFFWKLPREEKKGFAVVGVVSAILSFVIAKLVSLAYMDPRPFVVNHVAPLIPHAADNGFPSDHALLVGVLAAVVSLYDRRFGVILWVIALIVGISRVFVGVHHLVDILGSFLIAILSAYAVKRLYSKRTNATI
ncbi:MAG: phosphatase family protein [Parcubacteria group bacterium]|nr:phosphatase family protein [Parcubacteria group bacterium]